MLYNHLLKNVPFWGLSMILCFQAEASSRKFGCDAGCGIGYRGDQIVTAISGEENFLYKERNRNLRAVVLDGYLELQLWGFLFSSYVDVGWYVSGRTHNICAGGESGWPDYRVSFHQKTNGFLADGRQYAGLILDYTDTHRRGFKVIPEIGVGVFYQDLNRKPNQPESRLIPNQELIACDLSHHPMQQQWWGPLAGGRLAYQPSSAWSLEGGYYYYFLQWQQKSGWEQYIIYLTGSSMASEYFLKSRYEAKAGNLRGQVFCGKIKAQVAESWRLNWRMDLYRFAAADKKITVRQTVQQVYPAFETVARKQKSTMRSRWSALSAIFEVERFF